MIDVATRQPVDLFSVNDGVLKDYVEAEKECPIAKPSRVRISDEAKLTRTLVAQYGDIDMNGHVNNVHYAEWMLESVPADFAAAHRPVEMEIVFRSETLRGDFVVSRTLPGPAAPDGSPTFIHRVSDPSGRDHVLASTRWRSAT